MKVLYRGSKQSGLKVMEPRLVNHDKPYVYATPYKLEALIYSISGGNFTYTNVIQCYDDGTAELIERVPDVFKNKFMKVEGRIYHLFGDTFYLHEEEGVGNHEYVSDVPVSVIEEEVIPDVWEYYKDMERQGILKIYLYPNRPNWIPKDDSDLIECAEIGYKQGIDGAYDMLLKYHPHLKDRVRRLYNERKR